METLKLYQNNTAAEGKLPLPTRAYPTLSPAKLALVFLYDLSCTLSCDPHALCLGGTHTVTAFFQNSCYACADFLQDYAQIVAALSLYWPVTVYGTMDGTEVGEVRIRQEADGLYYIKSDVSGREFDLLSDLCVQITTGSGVDCAALREALSRMRFCNAAVALHRQHYAFCHGAGREEPMDGTRFLYLPMTADAGTHAFLACLSIEQKAELWEEYLLNGVSALEFDWLMEEYLDGIACGLIEWELALRMVIPQLGILVKNEPDQFHVTGPDGKPLRLSYTSSPAAGKFFLKILFPANPI